MEPAASSELTSPVVLEAKAAPKEVRVDKSAWSFAEETAATPSNQEKSSGDSDFAKFQQARLEEQERKRVQAEQVHLILYALLLLLSMRKNSKLPWL